MATGQLILLMALKRQFAAVFCYQTIVPWRLKSLISGTLAIFLELFLTATSKVIRSVPDMYWNCSKLLFCWVVLTASLI